MNIKQIIYGSGKFREFKELSENPELYITGIYGSLLSYLLDYCSEEINKKIIFVSSDNDKLIKLKDDISLISGQESISVFSSEKTLDSFEITKSLTDLVDNKYFTVFIHSKELSRNVIEKERYKDSLLELRKEQNFGFEELTEKLGKYNFNKKDFVEEVGDFAVRGGIIDLFPEHSDSPLRIEFFGNTVESIREFDITTQRSLREVESVKIGINLFSNDDADSNVNISGKGKVADYFPQDAILFLDEPELICNDAEGINLPDEFRGKIVNISAFSMPQKQSIPILDFDSTPQQDFHSNLKLLYNYISEKLTDGYDVHVTCSDDYQAKRMKSLLEDFEDQDAAKNYEGMHKQSSMFKVQGSILNKEQNAGVPKPELGNEELTNSKTEPFVSKSAKLRIEGESIHTGFVYPDCKQIVITEHQVFGRYFRQLKKRRNKFRGISFEEVKELKRGDFVVHRDFGIGIFSGLKKIKVGDSEQEVVKLNYAEGDTMFLNLNYVNLIKKYSGTDGYTPKLTRLGGGEWEKIKERTKKKVKDIARDLIILYAKRKSDNGYSFSIDSPWQRELEASFMYEDTPDQYTATEDVKRDMESVNPMDRLVCGDVGFGKTEVAVRAAFKAVVDNKQVALLVPTTILAVQHYNTFRDRLSPFAAEVECITRFQTKKEQKEILDKLEEGKVNILIGTHRLLSKDIKFKDLGLLVIDEEQRFGVKAKEKLRAIKPNVDTLTLTATPIPRTLNFSLLGARDLSLINTPPKNRKSIITEIITLDWKYITEIIKKEIDRNGQVYFVNDKVSNLGLLADKLKKLLPQTHIGIAHGQMDGNELEDVIVNFIEKKLNVLFCTKIIESGLDIPNVNTIIINNANMYGLSELYQLRGRVGRSEAQAYAYFVSPPAGKLTGAAIRRLQAIEEYTELGSGFNLAMRDMEIRGVGNLLGKEQSGFVQQMGFEMFIDIINEAVSELKETEFKELFAEEKNDEKPKPEIKLKSLETSTIIESDIDALIPKAYIENDNERLNIYKRLYETRDITELNLIRGELKDRFGEYLEDVDNLLNIIGIKITATNLGLEKITLHGRTLCLYFPQDKTQPFKRTPESAFFTKLIEKIAGGRKEKYRLVNDKEKLNVLIHTDGKNDAARMEELKQILSS